MAIIDYLSFSYTPDIISSVIERIGNRSLYCSKSILRNTDSSVFLDTDIIKIHNSFGSFDIRDTKTSFQKIESMNADCFYSSAAAFLDVSTFEITKGMNYELIKDSIYNFLGYSMLDNLCRSSVEMFINRFNHSCNSAGNKWTIHENKKGMFGFKFSADMKVNGLHAGVVAWGASNGGCYVSFSGSAIPYLDIKEIYKLLSSMKGVQLTRVDLAQDFYQGEYSCTKAFAMWKRDGFKSVRGKAPSASWVKSGGVYDKTSKKVEYKSGRTLYVGDRKNGKCIRIYEKGLQMKSADFPKWVRWEVQIGNKGRDIPFEILLNPTDFFRGSYPCLSSLVCSDDVCEVKTKTRIYTKTIEKMKLNLKTSAAKRLCFLRDGLGLDASKILDDLIGDVTIDDLDDNLLVAAVSHYFGHSQYDAEQLVLESKILKQRDDFAVEVYAALRSKRDYLNKVAKYSCVPF